MDIVEGNIVGRTTGTNRLPLPIGMLCLVVFKDCFSLSLEIPNLNSAEILVPLLVTCFLSVRNILENSLQIRRIIEIIGKFASTHMPLIIGVILETTEIAEIRDHLQRDPLTNMMILKAIKIDHRISVGEAPMLP